MGIRRTTALSLLSRETRTTASKAKSNCSRRIRSVGFFLWCELLTIYIYAHICQCDEIRSSFTMSRRKATPFINDPPHEGGTVVVLTGMRRTDEAAPQPVSVIREEYKEYIRTQLVVYYLIYNFRWPWLFFFFLQQSTADSDVNYLQWPGEIETQDENETIEFVRTLLARGRCMRIFYMCVWFYEWFPPPAA